MAMKDARDEVPEYGRRARSKIAANVALVSVLAVVLIVFVNYGLNQYGRDHDVRFDLTKSQWFSLQDSTKKLVRSIEEPLDVYIVYGLDRRLLDAARATWDAKRPDSGLVDRVYRPFVAELATTAATVISEARQLNPKLRVRFANADQAVDEPRAWARTLGVTGEQLVNHVAVHNPRTGAKQLLSFYKLFDMNLGGPDPARGHVRPRRRGDYVELNLAFAIKSVLTDEKPVVYFATGHEEVETSARVILSGDGFDVRELNLGLSESVPKDCDLLIIVSPARAWLPQAVEAVERYFERGGRLLITQGRYAREEFRELLRRFGVEPVGAQLGHVTNFVRTEGKYSLYGVDLLKPEKGPAHPVVAPTVGSSLPIYLGFCRGYRLLDDYESDRIDRHVLAHTGPGGEPMPWIHDGRDWRQAPERPRPPAGDYPLMVAVERRSEEADGETEITARAIVCGSDEWLQTRVLTRGFNMGNTDILLGAAYWLTGKEKMIVGTPRVFRGTLAKLDEDKHRTFQLITVAIIPVLVLLVGVLVFLMRRR